jgi:hypothetical protein
MQLSERRLMMGASPRCWTAFLAQLRSRAVRLTVIAVIVSVSSIAPTPSEAAELSIATMPIAAGLSSTITVEYRAKGAAVAALQFDLEFDTSIFSITSTAGTAASDAQKSLSTATLANGRTRFVLVGFNRNVLSDGVLVDLTIRVDSQARPGRYTLQISNIVGADVDALVVPVEVKSAGVIVRP